MQTNDFVKPKKRRWWIVIVVLLLVLVGGGIVYSYMGKPKVSNYVTEVAQKRDLKQSVSVTGTVKPAQEIDLSFKGNGTIEKVNVKVGDQVKKGTVLAKLDTVELDSQANQSKAGIAVAQAQLQQLLEGTRGEEITIQETNVTNAENNLKSAEKNKDLTKQNIDNDLVQAKTTVDNTNKLLQEAQKNLVNIRAQAENNVKNSIDNNLNQVNVVLLSEQGVLNNIKEIWGNITWYNNFRNMDFSTVIAIQNLLDQTTNLKNSADLSYNQAKISKSEIDNNKAVNDTLLYINNISLILSDYNKMVYSENAKFFFHESDLNVLKSRQSSNEGTNNANLNTVQGLVNAIANTKTNNQLSIDNAINQIVSYQNQVKTAEENVTKIQINSESQMQKAVDQVDTAKDQLKIQKDQLTLKKAGPTSGSINVVKAQISQAQAGLDIINAQIKNMSIIAPADGVITIVNINPGELSSAKNPAIQLHSDAKFDIEAQIAETDIAKVKVNDKADVTFDAFTKKDKYTATVTKIDPAATVIQGVVYYKTTLVIDSEDEKIKSGMTANVEIITAEMKDVMSVPNQSVKPQGDKSVVDVLVDETNDKIETKEVTTGLRANAYLEIKLGLNGGEKVVILKNK